MMIRAKDMKKMFSLNTNENTLNDLILYEKDGHEFIVQLNEDGVITISDLKAFKN